ncbi:MAG: hypothetical protein ABI625_20515 [bacterium]
MSPHTLDEILDALDGMHQRATYGAVAAVVGRSPRTLMKGRERDQRHSWVVGRHSGRPTGYETEQLHPDLTVTDLVIETREELAKWLTDAACAVRAISRAEG